MPYSAHRLRTNAALNVAEAAAIRMSEANCEGEATVPPRWLRTTSRSDASIRFSSVTVSTS